MSPSFITQCPHCRTSFRVRADQLSVANGSVRCGACLQVFSAREHQLSAAVTQMKPSPSSTNRGEANPSRRSTLAPGPKADQLSSTEEDFEFSTSDEDSTEFLFADEDEFAFSEDGMAEELYDDDEDELGELSDSFLKLDSSANSGKQQDPFSDTTAPNPTPEPGAFELNESSDESWAESILEELESEDQSPDLADSLRSAAGLRQAREQDTDEQLSAPLAANELVDIGSAYAGISAKESIVSASQIVNEASRELELDFKADERINRLRPLGWALCLILLTTLLLQIAWQQRATYARMDQWRGLYQQACDLIGCELPDQVDLAAIRTSVLIREHRDPELQDIRIVDVVLTNRAAFKQPFPQLIVEYRDVNGRLIADQSFSPTTYLEGEMTGVNLMPINTRVYVSFPIRKPPVTATNYQLRTSS